MKIDYRWVSELPEPGYRLRQPVAVEVREDEGSFSVSCALLYVASSGESREAAIENWASLLIDTYEDYLKTPDEALSDFLKKKKACVLAVVEPVSRSVC